jgi:L-seryl-tRNA(Ser) seleniumtransferase
MSRVARAGDLPYERGRILRSTEDDFAKLQVAWAIVAERHSAGTLFDFTGLVRSMLAAADPEPEPLDDELAPALHWERVRGLALEHLGGDPERDDVLVANRLTAAIFAAVQVLLPPGGRAVGVSAGYSHPAVARAVRWAGGELDDGGPFAGADLIVLTRLAVTYDALSLDDVEATVAAASDAGIPVFVDDAGGARVCPAVFGQPRTLELGVELGATGLDKYGTVGPRLGLLAGRRELVAKARALAIELGMEARPMLYGAVVRSLEQYRPERVRELVAATREVGDALERRLAWVERTPVAVKLPGAGTLAEAARRANVDEPALAPVEATAALAMLLLRDHGVHTVHFAALPPGTDALLLKFVPPETLERFGGPERLAAAVDESIDGLAELLPNETALRRLLGEPQ